MKRTNQIQGRRLADVEFRDNYLRRSESVPGDFFRVLNDPTPTPPSNLTGEVWYVTTPNGLLGNLAAHTVREEDDGSITVSPGDGSSNSILVQGADRSWHGYITRGLWWELG